MAKENFKKLVWKISGGTIVSRVSDVHCPKKLKTHCKGCKSFERVANGSYGSVNFYCNKKGVVS